MQACRTNSDLSLKRNPGLFEFFEEMEYPPKYAHHQPARARDSNESQKRVDRGVGCIVLFVDNCSGSSFQQQSSRYKHADDRRRCKVFVRDGTEGIIRTRLSRQHVAIVSQSRRHFVRPTFLEAALAAREAEPDQIPFVIRIGRDAAFHIGAVSF